MTPCNNHTCILNKNCYRFALHKENPNEDARLFQPEQMMTIGGYQLSCIGYAHLFEELKAEIKKNKCNTGNVATATKIALIQTDENGNII